MKIWKLKKTIEISIFFENLEIKKNRNLEFYLKISKLKQKTSKFRIFLENLEIKKNYRNFDFFFENLEIQKKIEILNKFWKITGILRPTKNGSMTTLRVPKGICEH